MQKSQFELVDHLSEQHQRTTGRRTILFLQGHPSSFARHLADALEKEGCTVLRINFCAGDWFYWLGRRALNYRGSFKAWKSYLTAFIHNHKVTDILYYGDCKPYHKVAGDLANDLGIRAFTYEFGYIRPDWITLERNGMSTRSHFPNDPNQIVAISRQCAPPDLEPKYRHTMTTELIHEIFYNLASFFLSPTFMRYNADRYYNPVLEYLTGLPKQFTTRRRNEQADELIREFVQTEKEFFLFPLQLQCDYQLRSHAGFAHQSDAIKIVVASFARNASPNAHLVFKCHPFDNDGENWPRHIRLAAAAFSVEDRVRFIDGGNLETLLSHSKGCVLINSTVGMHALMKTCPTKVLGGAVFDIAGLTHQGPLDTFWQLPEQPDADLAVAFVQALAGTIQVKGNFFTAHGQAAAIPVFVQRIMQHGVNGHGAFVRPPPRLMDAQRIKL